MSEDLYLLVGFSEGRASNIVAHMISPALGKALNQTVGIERIPGENGALCAERVARAAPDGRTLAIAIQTHLRGDRKTAAITRTEEPYHCTGSGTGGKHAGALGGFHEVGNRKVGAGDQGSEDP